MIMDIIMEIIPALLGIFMIIAILQRGIHDFMIYSFGWFFNYGSFLVLLGIFHTILATLSLITIQHIIALIIFPFIMWIGFAFTTSSTGCFGTTETGHVSLPLLKRIGYEYDEDEEILNKMWKYASYVMVIISVVVYIPTYLYI